MTTDGNGRQNGSHILAECTLKLVNVILSSRLSQATGPATQSQRPNRWFQLELDDSPALRSLLEQGCRADPTTPVELEVYCCPAGRPEVVLVERWRICLGSSWPLQPYGGATPLPRMAGSSSSSSGGSTGGRLVGEEGALYKRLTLLVRALCCHLRVLPTHRLHRAFKRQPIAVWRLCCRVVRGSASLVCPPNATLPTTTTPGSSSEPKSQLPLSCKWSAPPVPALGGGFRVSVEHIAADAVTALEAAAAGCPAPPAPQRLIINDYYDATAAAAAAASSPAMHSHLHGRPPLPSTPPPTKGMSIPQSYHNQRGGVRGGTGLAVDGMAHADYSTGASPGRAVGTPTPGSSGPTRSSGSMLRPSAASSPVVRQSWGRKAQGPLPPPSPTLPIISIADTGSVLNAADGGGAVGGCGEQLPAAGQQPGPLQQQQQQDGNVPVQATNTVQQQQHHAVRSISTPADVASIAAQLAAQQAAAAASRGDAAQAAGDTAAAAGPAGAGAGAGGAASSAPVLIPGGQPRVRSFADMHIVYNFPDNLHNPAPSHRGRPLASSTSGPTPLVTHTHGSAPAAPRGMLGQALEAHLASLKAMAGTPTPLPAGAAVTAAGIAALAQTVPTAGAKQHDVADTSRSSSVADDGHMQQVTGGAAPSFSSGVGSQPAQSQQPPHQVAVPMPRGPHADVHRHAQAHSSRPHGSSWRGMWTPESPQLPFAFTPAAHSLGVSNPAHLGGRFPGGSSIPASPSWNSLRVPSGASYQAHGPFRPIPHTSSPSAGTPTLGSVPATAAGVGSSGSGGGNASTVVISGRDVSALALARRPSWIEHSARMGRSSSSTSGDPSPSEPHSCGARRHMGPSGSGAVLASSLQPPCTVLQTRLSSSPGPAAAGAAAASAAQTGHPAGTQPVSAACKAAPASPATVTPHQPQAGAAQNNAAPGCASWLQPPRLSIPLTAGTSEHHAHIPVWDVVSPSGLRGGAWPTYPSPPDLPPLMLVTVPVPSPDADPAAGLPETNDPDDNDDLPFLLDPAEEEAVLGQQVLRPQAPHAQQAEAAVAAHTCSKSVSWVHAIKPLVSSVVSAAGGGHTAQAMAATGAGSSPALPVPAGGLRLPSRDVAVGMLLAHLAAPSSHTPGASGQAGTVPSSPAQGATCAPSLVTNGTPAVSGALAAHAPQRESSALPDTPELTLGGPELTPGDMVKVPAACTDDPPASCAPITCAAAMEQLMQLQEQLDALLSFPAHL